LKFCEKKSLTMNNFIIPNWPVPAKIKAFTTTRANGFSSAPFDSFNLAAHVGDSVEAVAQNREYLRKVLQLRHEPFWLLQTHSTTVVEAENEALYLTADASYTREVNTVCAVLTADCLPLLICDQNASCVAAVHAGWKGLLGGIIEEALKALKTPGEDLLAWLGPAIGAGVYEVGEEVQEKFIAHDISAKASFRPLSKNKYLMDIYSLARQRLARQNITRVYGGEFCTLTQKDKFFSYRRDRETGRMASLIWIE
jgi:polyphenol oxidase